MRKFLLFVGLLAAPSSLFAWSDLGHQATAEVAERFLNGRGKKLVNEILGNGPLAEASTFSDLVKSDKAYADFSNLHFVEIDPRWQTYDKIPAALRPQRDANSVLIAVPAKLFTTTPVLNKNQRQDFLKFLVHVVGDVHHPLHVGNSYDRGGTWCDIKYPGNDGQATELVASNLHGIWDDQLVKFIFKAQTLKDPNFKLPKFQGYSELTDLILNDADIVKLKDSYPRIANTPIGDWYRESQSLHSKVYPDPTPVNDPTARTYCRHLERDENGLEKKDKNGVTIVIPATSVATVDLAYMQRSAEIIKFQILKGGLRLATILNKMGERQYSQDLSPEQKAQDLKQILDQLNNVTAAR